MKKSIKRRKRFIRNILIILLIIIGFSFLISKVTYSHGEKQFKTILVSEGDTLWNIACSEVKSNNYYKGKDIRYVLSNLIRENNLKNSNINVNQKLLVPTI